MEKADLTAKLNSTLELKSSENVEKIELISLSQWLIWVLNAIKKIRSQKMRPSLERIVNAIRHHHRFPIADIETQIEQCVKNGNVLKVLNRGQYTYTNPNCTENRKQVVNEDTDIRKSQSLKIEFNNAEITFHKTKTKRKIVSGSPLSDDESRYKKFKKIQTPEPITPDESLRCPPAIQFGKYELETWYSSPFPHDYATLKKLFLCEFCLIHTKSKSVLDRHMPNCFWRTPPGTEIYRSEDLSVYEIDGKTNKTYCQSLCLLGKLFLDSKVLFFEVEPFLFYVLTKSDGFGSHLVGYFSKEKGTKNNVSCICTLPPYQRQGFGRFLIDFSYLLSKKEGKLGTPERPLSDLGQASYNAYWKTVVLDYLYEHRNSTDSISVDDISNKTGLIGDDIKFVLLYLNMAVEIGGTLTICIDWRIVDTHYKTKNISKQIHIDPECLKWIY